MGTLSRRELAALVEEATVDTYDEHERVSALFTAVEENLAVPFSTSVLGVEVTVRGIDLSPDGRIVALCARGAFRQTIGLLDLPLPAPAPDGAEWVEAYRYYAAQ
ncbi:hypothetical protein GCM10009639_40270 [Kitasatospora putterlickiae]|uniref:Calcium binding protein n=1 Tax=Kitasatospora putterlickiae TaxID=221725 RepID=A0ABP4IVI9_9ACTN